VENFFAVQYVTLRVVSLPRKPAWMRGYSPWPRSSHTAAWRLRAKHLPCLPSPQSQGTRSQCRKRVLKRKDPSGGTTGRVKLYGRLGWMGARAEYSRWGGITAPTFISRSSFAGRSKGRSIFLTFYSGLRSPKITARWGD
jgi:hypothetical protein